MSPVILTHPTNPELSGPVSFRAPSVHTSVAIHARVSDLINAGRDPKLARVHPADLTLEGFRLAYAVATLEHVINSAPRGLYRDEGGTPVLDLGRLDEFEATEPNGVVMQLFTAYEMWRQSFRRARTAPPEPPQGE